MIFKINKPNIKTLGKIGFADMYSQRVASGVWKKCGVIIKSAKSFV